MCLYTSKGVSCYLKAKKARRWSFMRSGDTEKTQPWREGHRCFRRRSPQVVVAEGPLPPPPALNLLPMFSTTKFNRKPKDKRPWVTYEISLSGHREWWKMGPWEGRKREKNQQRDLLDSTLSLEVL